MTEDAVSTLENKILYTFKDKAIMQLAVSHTSYINECGLPVALSNERLEFLGDAVLELVVSSFLYAHFPHILEGEMTRLRASLVCEQSLAKRANGLRLYENLTVGKGEETTGGYKRDSVQADFFEAVIGAIYVDGGYDAAQKFIAREILTQLDGLIKHGTSDYKTALQELLQRNGPVSIDYIVANETGPSHAKTFTVNVVFERKILGTGTGKNKKEAEQNAAAQALKSC